MQDPELDNILRQFPGLTFRRRESEYRVFRPIDESKGSLWIARQRDGYRVVSTGTTHSIDGDIERLTGMRGREMSDRAHLWWKSVSLSTLKEIFRSLSAS
jgi:hypothetical protein